MPIYEYLCLACNTRSSILTLTSRQPDPVLCRHCGSSEVNRLLSRFASPKSEESRLASLADPANFDGLDESDPSSVARFMKKMGREMGEDASDVEAMLDETGPDKPVNDQTDGL